jgi:glycosyltransferase involved in cell wall biosynthesis
MEKHKVAIVIPAFNEEATISTVVYEAIKYGLVIVVNDASIDKTAQMAEKAGAIVVNHSKNSGYDNALNSGFFKAEELSCDFIITFDADGQHDAKLLKKYIEELKKGIDLVLGVRPNTARISEKLFMFYTKYKYNWKDPLCGMKGYSIRLYRQCGHFDSWGSIGTELAAYGLMNNFSYTQVNITIFDRKDRPRFSSTFKANIKIIRSMFYLIINRCS